MEVYAESLFIINFSVLFLCMLIPVKQFGVSKIRHISASIFGGIYSVFILNSELTALLIIIGYTLTGAIAFGKKIKGCIMFLALNFLVYSLVSFIVSATGNTSAYAKNGILYFNISAKKLILAFMLILPFVFTAEKIMCYVSKKKIHSLKITKKEKTVQVFALHDSGNLLTEPRSGKNVILVSKKALDVFDTESILINEKPIIIPYKSLGHQGVILGFSVDKVTIDNKKEINDAVIGISESEFCEGCEALIGGI